MIHITTGPHWARNLGAHMVQAQAWKPRDARVGAGKVVATFILSAAALTLIWECSRWL